jgi:hypothetical protein
MQNISIWCATVGGSRGRATAHNADVRTTSEQKSWVNWVRTVVAVLVPERLTHLV